MIAVVGLLLFLAAPTALVKGQEAQHVQEQEDVVSSIAKSLSIGRDKAAEVAAIQDNYKKGVDSPLSRTGLSQQDIRLKIDLLIESKNKKLGALLSAEQLDRMVPTTEREGKAPSTEKNTNTQRP